MKSETLAAVGIAALTRESDVAGRFSSTSVAMIPNLAPRPLVCGAVCSGRCLRSVVSALLSFRKPLAPCLPSRDESAADG
jgi:hypothetical protein